MSKGSALVYLTKGTASALISAAAGIVVAVPAVLIHNVLRTRVERMQRELSVTVESQGHIERSFRRAQILPLKRRFSGLPPFALLGAPTLACALMVFIGVRLSPGPAGLPVTVALDHCTPGMADRSLVLRVKGEGKLFLNYEPEDSKGLPGRLLQIYRMRVDRVLYIQADDDVPFQTVADAIDSARNPTTSAGSLHISVRLITPQTEVENAVCHAPVWRGSSVHGKK
ncbi:MAG: MotA/TolQ/ExbB proton channel family protein [Candidatus Sulfotelmatobacter sp.]